MTEGFIHPPWYNVDEFHDNYIKPLWQIEQLAYWSSRRKILLMETGCVDEDIYPSLTRKLMLYCLSAFLLGANSTAYFGWGNTGKTSRGYFPEMDTKIGNPISRSYQVNSDVYGRIFDCAKVFMNLSDTNTYKVTANKTIYTLFPRSGVVASIPSIPLWKLLLYMLLFVSTGLLGAKILTKPRGSQ